MTSTTLFSAVVSATAITSGMLLFNQHPGRQQVATAPIVQVVSDLPPVKDDTPDPKKSEDPRPDDEEVGKVNFAPPTLIDVPNVPDHPVFTQAVTPPPPPDMPKGTGLATIPVGSPSLRPKMGDIFDPSQLERQPVARVQMEPAYPYQMKHDGIDGEVTVCFIVDTNGDVRSAYVVSSSRRDFEDAAVQAVSKWKFKPGWKGGRPVNTRMLVPLIFRIEK
jgi:periplasmic protein TonB